MAKSTSENLITPAVLNAEQIDTTTIADNSITDDKIVNGTIQGQSIADDTIEPTKITSPGYIFDSVLTYDHLSGTLVWSDTYTYSDADWDARLATKDTDDLTEGSTNQYFTTTRAVDAVEAEASLTLGNISHSGNWTLSSADGEITITPRLNGYVLAEGDFYTGVGTGFYMNATTLSTWSTGSTPAITIDRDVNITEELTVADDVLLGESNVRNNTALGTKGIHITVDDTTTDKWAGIVLEEIGTKQFSMNNPLIVGQVSGGTAASPTAVPSSRRVINLTASARYGTGTSDFDTIAQVKLITNEQQSSTNRGGSIILEVNPNGGTTNTSEVVKVDADVGGTSQTTLRIDPNGNHSKSVITSQSSNGIEIDTQVVVLSNLPTSDPNNPGQLWNDGGTLKVS